MSAASELYTLTSERFLQLSDSVYEVIPGGLHRCIVSNEKSIMDKLNNLYIFTDVTAFNSHFEIIILKLSSF